MTEFEKKLKESSKKIDVPKGYSEKVDEVLMKLPEKNNCVPVKSKWSIRSVITLAACLILVICIVSFGTIKTDANVFSVLKKSIMDFLGEGDKASVDEAGVKSHKTYVKSKPDLIIELKETVVEKQNIYLMLQVTAPTDVELNEDIGFDYVALCKGEDFNTDSVLGGPISCTFLESMRGKPNIATYVLSMLSNEEFADGEGLIAHFRDLKWHPNDPDAEMIVEGTWSIAFTSNLTTREELKVEGTSDMTYPYVGTSAVLKEISITPLGMKLVSDISLADYNSLGVMDTTIAIRLKMLDGSEMVVATHDEEDTIVKNGSTNMDEAGEGEYYQTDNYEFQDVIDISKIAGVYVEDLYIPMGGN